MNISTTINHFCYVLLMIIFVPACQKEPTEPPTDSSQTIPAELRQEFISTIFEQKAAYPSDLFQGIEVCRLSKDSIFFLYNNGHGWNIRNKGFACKFRNKIIYVDSIPFLQWKNDTLFSRTPWLEKEATAFVKSEHAFPKELMVKKNELRLIRSWKLPEHMDDTSGKADGRYFKYIKAFDGQLYASPEGDEWFMFDPSSGMGSKVQSVPELSVEAVFWENKVYKIITHQNASWLAVMDGGEEKPLYFISHSVASPITFQYMSLVGIIDDVAYVSFHTEMGNSLFTVDMNSGKSETVYSRSWSLDRWIIAGEDLFALLTIDGSIVGLASINGKDIKPLGSFQLDISSIIQENSRSYIGGSYKLNQRNYLAIQEINGAGRWITHWVEWKR